MRSTAAKLAVGFFFRYALSTCGLKPLLAFATSRSSTVPPAGAAEETATFFDVTEVSCSQPSPDFVPTLTQPPPALLHLEGFPEPRLGDRRRVKLAVAADRGLPDDHGHRLRRGEGDAGDEDGGEHGGQQTLHRDPSRVGVVSWRRPSASCSFRLEGPDAVPVLRRRFGREGAGSLDQRLRRAVARASCAGWPRPVRSSAATAVPGRRRGPRRRRRPARASTRSPSRPSPSPRRSRPDRPCP